MLHTTIKTPAQSLISDVLAGKAKPYGANGYYEATDWAWAAQCAEDDNDTAEIEFMMGRETAWGEFREWQCGADRREFVDFADWLEGAR